MGGRMSRIRTALLIVGILLVAALAGYAVALVVGM